MARRIQIWRSTDVQMYKISNFHPFSFGSQEITGRTAHDDMTATERQMFKFCATRGTKRMILHTLPFHESISNSSQVFWGLDAPRLSLFTLITPVHHQ